MFTLYQIILVARVANEGLISQLSSNRSSQQMLSQNFSDEGQSVWVIIIKEEQIEIDEQN